MKSVKVLIKTITISLIAVVLSTSVQFMALRATELEQNETQLAGSFYEWKKENSKYPFSTSGSVSTLNSDTYGKFTLVGAISEMDEHIGTPSYLVKGNTNVSFKYTYGDSKISKNDQGDVNWHITNDGNKKIDNNGLDLGSKIKSGAIIIQTSLDGEKWINDRIITDAFATTPRQTDSIFSTNEIQLVNGTYYRFIVAYRERKLVGSAGWLVFQSLEYDYRERVEVYKVYLESETEFYHVDNDNRMSLGTTVNAGGSNGFNGTNPITSKDFQYGWDLGNFFVSGYSDKKEDKNGNPVFLKNVGDRVSLNYKLLQDINCLDGKDYLKINKDMDGSDAYFQTNKDVNFEKGALIIRFIDHEGIKHDQIYTNFLEANTRTGADTRVQLFEEGDYEIALDYEICNTRGVDSFKNYRAFFKFSVRNGNCMVFPFDSSTESELDNLAITPNGFTLDLAGSRWLHITVTRYILNSSGTGLDQRFSRNVAEEKPYTDPGIYKIEVTNEYAPNTTYSKIICVGSDADLIAFFKNKVVPNTSILK